MNERTEGLIKIETPIIKAKAKAASLDMHADKLVKLLKSPKKK